VLPHYRVLSILPLSHLLEQAVGLGVALGGGASIVYMGALRPDTIFEALSAERITCIIGVPQVLQLFMTAIEREVRRGGKERVWRWLHAIAPRLPIAGRRRLFRQVHGRLGGRFLFFACGGAHLPVDLARKWENLGVKVIQGYGITECGPCVAANSMDERNLASVGKPVSCNRVRLAPDGEIQVQGSNVTAGYWEDPVTTAAAFSDDGWFCTGDLARQDADGWLYFIGRKKNVIVLPSGENVYPEDLEALLVEQPGLKDAVVLGLAQPDGDVQVHAVLLTEPGADMAVATSVRTVNRRVNTHQRIRGQTVWPDADFPRTLTMKALRAQIEARLRELEAARAG
jgi:long-chain acyl-CoA synthetase